MEVIYTTDLSRPGNDVYIYESHKDAIIKLV